MDLTASRGRPEMNLAGFGDLLAMWTAPADWYLARAVGMDDSFHYAPIGLLREQGQACSPEPPVCAGVSRRCWTGSRACSP